MKGRIVECRHEGSKENNSVGGGRGNIARKRNGKGRKEATENMKSSMKIYALI